MKIIKPEKLKENGTIGILAVSGRIKEYERIEKAADFFEKRGFKTVISDTCLTSHRYMAGRSDEDCINALHNFFLDKNIDAVLCARGGYGALRLIDKINWNIIKENPKIFAGYSDITTLLAMIYKKTGLITFHSPMANGDFALETDEYTVNSFFNTLEGKTETIKAENPVIYKKGRAEGRLWGGNLASLAALCGRDFIPDDDIILFIEDVNEPAYKIDRMLCQLLGAAGFKKHIKALVIGEFKDTEDTAWLKEVLSETVQSLDIPAASGFKITHNKTKDTVPFGIKAEFDTRDGLIKFKENYPAS